MFEIISLFFLFQYFYKKSYSKKRKVVDDDDQCQATITSLTTRASHAVSNLNAAIRIANKNRPTIVNKHMGPL